MRTEPGHPTWSAVAPPAVVEGSAPATGRLEAPLRWLARCQDAWPPRRPTAQEAVRVHAPAQGDLTSGAALADAAADRGSDLLLVQGDGDPAEGLLVAAVLLGLEPVHAVGTAARSDWVRRTVAVRDGLRAGRPHRADPASLLDAVGAQAVAHLTGLLAQAAVRRTPVLLDGSALVAAAALCAARLAPGSVAWWLAGSGPPDPAARRAHEELRLTPLLDLGLASPAGAEMALAVLERAVDLLAP